MMTNKKRWGEFKKKKQEREKSNVTSRRTSFKVDCLHHDQGEETSYTYTHTLSTVACATRPLPPTIFPPAVST